MREIKFRGWDGKHMVTDAFGAVYVPSSQFQGLDMPPSYRTYLHNASFQVLMQYTGLKDKNGVEIYEGDILSMAGSITGAQGLNPGFFFDETDKVAIAWDNSIAAWSVAGELDKTDRVEVTYRNHVIQLIHQGACEVIGNIYENPELLTKT